MLKICVYAIAKNEIKFIDRWYNSVKEADYICVLDTGSSDGSYEKFKSLGIIAHYLGAKEYETTFAITESKERIINANGELDYKLINAASSVRIKENDSMTGKYYRHETFRGEFSMASYNQAVLEAKQNGLYDDDDINYLLKTRNPKFGNQLTSQHVRFNLTKELNSQLDIAFSLKVSSIFKLSANYNQIVSKKQDILIETKLIFE